MPNRFHVGCPFSHFMKTEVTLIKHEVGCAVNTISFLQVFKKSCVPVSILNLICHRWAFQIESALIWLLKLFESTPIKCFKKVTT